MTPTQRDELLRRLRDPRNQFLFDPDVSKEAWKLLKDAADAIESLTRPEAQGETRYEIVHFERPGPIGARQLWVGICTEKQAIKNWKYFLKEFKNAELLMVTTQRTKVKP